MVRKLSKAALKKKRQAIARKNFGISKKRSKTLIKSTRGKSMAKRKTRRATRKSMSILGINTAKALAAGLYGAVRARTSNTIAPYTSRIPLGNVSDEAGMLLVSTLAKKYLVKRSGVLRDALTAGQTIELARIGEAIASGNLGIGLGGSSNGESSNGYVFA